ncbi:hypothetical protein [Mycobacteroides abscessus]|uniref:hypothetical protein n=1 Tax=Mycobacteroides abscessus TaxID=36809 RepID=UPI0019D1D173|nr:hypothetical protein [Mycobacteroides abscessus]
MRNAGLAAVVVAAAVLSACSNGAAPKPWADVTPSPVGVTETVGETAPVWQDVAGQGVVRRDDPAKGGDQWSPVPIPGIKIGRLSDTDPSGTAKCTLGPAVAGGFLTAGHCADGKAGTEQYAQVHPDGSAPLDLGVTEPAQGVDAAVIRTAVAPGATRIAGTWPVAGVLTAKGVQQLVPVGSMICFDGAVSGVRCGKRVADDGEMVVRVSSTHGDSGAPVFVVDDQSRAALLGILRDGDGSETGVTSLDAALLATGTAVQLDPDTVAFDGPGFSRWIALK